MHKELLKNILNDTDTEHLLLTQLQNQLDEELKKPLKSRDYDKIDALSCEITELALGHSQFETKTESGIAVLKSKAEKPESIKRTKRFRPAFITLCSLAVIITTLNVVTLSTSGMNLFSAIVKYSKEAVSFTFQDNNESDPTSDSQLHTYDDFGILRKCEEFGISPDVPHYIPQGFILSDFIFHDLTVSDVLYFCFTKENASLNISYQSYHSNKDIPPQLIPSDNHDFSAAEINGSEAFILKEDNCYTALYQKNNVVCIYSCEGMDYNEFISVINSVK